MVLEVKVEMATDMDMICNERVFRNRDAAVEISSCPTSAGNYGLRGLTLM